MVIGQSSPYQLGTRFSLSQMLAESLLSSGSGRRTPLGVIDLRSTLRASNAYELLLSQSARRSEALASLKVSRTSGGQKLIDEVVQQGLGRTKAEQYGIKGEQLAYLKETLPDSYLVETKYQRLSRAKVAQSVEALYKRLDEGLSKVNVKARETTGLVLKAGSTPSWLKFDARTGTFFGTPPDNFSGEVEVALRASLPDGRYAEDTVTLNFVRPNANNRAPYTTRNLQYFVDPKTNQPLSRAVTGEGYTVTIPENFFNDDDVNDEIQVRVRVKGDERAGFESARDGVSAADKESGWPDWLTFHPQLRLFSGSPPASEAGKAYTFVVTAQDRAGAKVSSEFTLKVESGEDSKAENVRSLDHQSVGADRAFTYSKPFDDVFRSLDSSYRVKATLANGKPLPTWLRFAVDTVDPPRVAKVIPPQAFFENTGFVKGIFLDEILEDEGSDRYEVTAQLSSGGGTPGALPGWLNFDDKTNIFSVKADASPPPGVYEVHLQIADVDDGYTVNTSFKLTVNGAGRAVHVPTSKVSFDDLVFPRSLLPTTTLPDGTVKDPNKIAIPNNGFGEEPTGGFNYTLTLKDGSPAPSWVTLQNGFIVKGAAPASAAGKKIELSVTAEHPVTGFAASSDFSLEVLPEDVEVERVPLPGTLYVGKKGDKLALPRGVFSYEKSDLLAYSSALAGGGSLPLWLKFDEKAQSFSLDESVVSSLTSPPNGDYSIEVKARDATAGKENTVVFSLAVRNVGEIAPKPQAKTGEVKGRLRNDGSTQAIFLGDDLFSEPEAGESYSYEVKSRDGSPLSSWLTFDPLTLTLSGTPPAGTTEEEFSLVLVAKDGRGESASVDVNLSLISRDATRRLKLYGDPRGQGVGSYDIVFEAGQGSESAKSILNLSVTKGGGVLTGVTSTTPIPNQNVDQRDTLSQSFRVSNHFNTDFYNTRYVLREKNGAPVPPWLSFSVTTDQAPLASAVLKNITLVKGDNLKLDEQIDISKLLWDEPSDEIKVSASLAGGGALPSWLSFDEKTNRLSILDKDAAVAGNYTVRYTFRDETDGYQVSLDQTLRIHPENTVLTPPQTPPSFGNGAKIGSGVGETVDLKFSTKFGNPKGSDSFSYDVTRVDGRPLPTWLRHDAANPGNLEIVGTSPVESSENFNILVRVTNSQGVERRVVVPLTVFKEGDYFTEDEKAVSLYSGTKKQAFSLADRLHTIALPSLLKDLDVSATLAGGGVLPSWLSFDDEKATFKVDETLITTADFGVHDVEVTILDTASGVSDTLSLKVYINDEALRKDPPKEAYGIPRSAFRVGSGNSVILKRDIFEAPPAGETYSYELKQTNGDPLPLWLSYDATTRTLSGTPPAGTDLRRALSLKYVARDARGAEVTSKLDIHFTDRAEDPKFVLRGKPEKQEDVKTWDFEIGAVNVYGERASSDFSVTVNDVNTAPRVKAYIPERTLSQGEKLTINLKKHFEDIEEADPENSHLLTYSLATRDGSPLPSWFTIDNTDKSLSVNVPSIGAVGLYDLALTVTGPGGLSITHNVDVDVKSNHAPRFIRDFGLQSVGGGGRQDVALDGFVLSDFDGSAALLSFRLESSDEKKEVPGWVRVDNGSRQLKLEPPLGVSGFYRFNLVAVDEEGAEVRQEVSVYVGGDEKPSLSFTSGKVNLAAGQDFRFSVPSYAFSIPEGESVRYTTSEASGMTSYDVDSFKVLSELVWDEVLGKSKYSEDFSYLDEEHAVRVTGYLAAMDVLSGGKGDLKNFSHIRNKLPYLDRSLFDQELLTVRNLLPVGRVKIDRDKALKLVGLALDRSALVEGRVKSDGSDKEALDKVQDKIDKLLNIDWERLKKEREIPYESIGNSTARARSTMELLAEYILAPALGESKGIDDEVSVNLSKFQKSQANAVYKMLLRNLSFGRDTPTVDKVAEHDKRVIGGLMRTLDYLTGGEGKNFDFGNFIEKLPKENRQYGERYLKELSTLFEVDKVEILGDEKSAFSSIARLSAEYDAYLSLPQKTQSLHTKRMQELQYQMEAVFRVKNSPTARALASSRTVDYSALFGGGVAGPTAFLSRALASPTNNLLKQGVGGLFGTGTGNRQFFGESGGSAAVRLLGG